MYSVNIEVIRKHPQENIESLLRRFKRKVKNSGLMDVIKKNEFYTKPSILKKEKRSKNRFRK